MHPPKLFGVMYHLCSCDSAKATNRVVSFITFLKKKARVRDGCLHQQGDSTSRQNRECKKTTLKILLLLGDTGIRVQPNSPIILLSLLTGL